MHEFIGYIILAIVLVLVLVTAWFRVRRAEEQVRDSDQKRINAEVRLKREKVADHISRMDDEELRRYVTKRLDAYKKRHFPED